MKEQINKLIKERRSLEQILKKETKMGAAVFCRREQGSAYLGVCIDGINRTRYVRKDDENEWRALTKEWKIFSEAIARWVVLGKELERTFRDYGKSRLVPIPAKKDRRQKE